MSRLTGMPNGRPRKKIDIIEAHRKRAAGESLRAVARWAGISHSNLIEHLKRCIEPGCTEHALTWLRCKAHYARFRAEHPSHFEHLRGMTPAARRDELLKLPKDLVVESPQPKSFASRRKRTANRLSGQGITSGYTIEQASRACRRTRRVRR